MNVRIRWRSVLPLVLPLFFFAVLNHSVSLAGRQNQSQEESTSFKNVQKTVLRLLSVPMYTASDEKLLNEAGDGAALEITRIVSQQEMGSAEIRRRILLILHLAFEAPQSIIERNNKTPTAALRLVDQLQRADSNQHFWTVCALTLSGTQVLYVLGAHVDPVTFDNSNNFRTPLILSFGFPIP